MRIIADTWRSGRTSVGIVLVEQDGRTQAYIGASQHDQRQSDIQAIAEWGARLSYREAKGFFPELAEDSYGTDD